MIYYFFCVLWGEDGLIVVKCCGGVFVWVREVFKVKEDDIVVIVGLDVVVYMYFFIVGMFCYFV